jgi:hypothetical protein
MTQTQRRPEFRVIEKLLNEAKILKPTGQFCKGKIQRTGCGLTIEANT